MGECICSGCSNLKAVIDEAGESSGFDCGFGFPSGECETCDREECDIICIHYEEECDEYEETVTCAKCGKEIKKSFREDTEGDIFCVDCFLSQ